MTKPKNELGEQKMALIPVAQYKELLELCLRAADALEEVYGPLPSGKIDPDEEGWLLIAELRKAAQ